MNAHKIIRRRVQQAIKVRQIGKTFLVTQLEGPWGCETSRLPHLLDNRLTAGSKVFSFTRPASLYPIARFLISISVRGWVDTRAIVRLERLGKLKKSSDLIGTRTRHPTTSSILLRPTTLPRASKNVCILSGKSGFAVSIATGYVRAGRPRGSECESR
jgi:hypothetical protein